MVPKPLPHILTSSSSLLQTVNGVVNKNEPIPANTLALTAEIESNVKKEGNIRRRRIYLILLLILAIILAGCGVIAYGTNIIIKGLEEKKDDNVMELPEQVMEDNIDKSIWVLYGDEWYHYTPTTDPQNEMVTDKNLLTEKSTLEKSQ